MALQIIVGLFLYAKSLKYSILLVNKPNSILYKENHTASMKEDKMPKVYYKHYVKGVLKLEGDIKNEQYPRSNIYKAALYAM